MTVANSNMYSNAVTWDPFKGCEFNCTYFACVPSGLAVHHVRKNGVSLFIVAITKLPSKKWRATRQCGALKVKDTVPGPNQDQYLIIPCESRFLIS